MISKLLKPLRFLALAVTSEATPRRVAMGFAIGAAIGLVPKDNLIALALIVLLFALRVNILAGIVAAFMFTAIGMVMTPFLNQVGESILSVTSLQYLYGRLYAMPLGAWSRFNNTLVAGGLCIGLLQLYPLYRLMTVFFRRRLERWSTACEATQLGQTLLGPDNGPSVTSWRVG